MLDSRREELEGLRGKMNEKSMRTAYLHDSG